MRSVRDDRRLVNARLDRVRAGVLVGLSVLVFSYWFLQFLRGEHYRSLSENNRLRSLPIHAVRGVVLDRGGRVLTENDPAFNLLLYRREVRDLDATRRFLMESLGLSPEQIRERLERGKGHRDFMPVRLAEDVPPEIVAAVEAHHPEHPELAIEITEKRRYKSEPRAAHLLGYLGEATPDMIRKAPDRYRPGDPVGLAGLEAVYDAHLAGSPGERNVVVDSLGREVLEASKRSAVAGRSLPLSVDLRLQRLAEEYFSDKVGAVAAIDPTDGAILALVSAPDFDPNAFVGRVSPAIWKTLITDERHPLQNRAIQNTYSPGSVFKIVMAWAALETGGMSPEEQVFCPGAATFYGNTFRCHKPGGHGWCDVRRALEVSCDVFFYTVGRRIGIDAIAEASTLFGLGRPTGIDLPGEKKGLVPSEGWSRAVRKHPWYAGETISVAIGQGPLLVTPLQLARMAAAVANGGRLVTPHLAASPPPALPEPSIPMKPSTREALLDGLSRVVQGGEGTAHAARVPGVEVLGKTGTVQVIRQKKAIKSEDLAYQFRDHAWFVASAPRENPKIALAIFVEHGGHGGSTAAPLAAKMIRAWLTDSWPAPQPIPAAPPPMPDPLPDDERLPAAPAAPPPAVAAARPTQPRPTAAIGGTP